MEIAGRVHFSLLITILLPLPGLWSDKINAASADLLISMVR